ncbi:hypothetical protein ONZ45_g5694 [Pleurotus djamor]|nr:hypothetical protein ONZ45_g5694 [Pleurotus djamor]
MLLGRVNIMDAEEAPVPDGQSSIQLVFNVRGKSAYSEPFSTMRDYGKMTRWHLAYVVCEKIVKFLMTQASNVNSDPVAVGSYACQDADVPTTSSQPAATIRTSYLSSPSCRHADHSLNILLNACARTRTSQRI